MANPFNSSITGPNIENAARLLNLNPANTKDGSIGSLEDEGSYSLNVSSTGILSLGDAITAVDEQGGEFPEVIDADKLEGHPASYFQTASDVETAINAKIVQTIGSSTSTVMSQNAVSTIKTNLETSIEGKQDTLVSGTNIKTINNNSILGSGDITISGGEPDQYIKSAAQSGNTLNLTNKDGTVTSYTPTGASAEWGSITGTLSNQSDLQTALDTKQATLVSGTNIKTINSNTILGTGDLNIPIGDDVKFSTTDTTMIEVTDGTGTPVEANPTGTATETLEKLKVGETIYSVEGGGSDKMDKANPTGTGSFSLNRKSDTTTGSYSFAEGYDNTASGYASHAEGSGTTASAEFAHAEGISTTASEYAAHAEGGYTIASGKYSHAQNYYTAATYTYATAIGKYNLDGNYAFMIGNGSSSARSNALTVGWEGDVVAAGSLRATSLTDGTTTKTMTEILAGGGGGGSLPSIVSGDAGKVLTVKSDETGTEWKDFEGASAYAETITGTNLLTEFTITHGLGTRDICVQVYDLTTYESVLPDIIRETTNTVKIKFNEAPAYGKTYRVVCQAWTIFSSASNTTF